MKKQNYLPFLLLVTLTSCGVGSLPFDQSSTSLDDSTPSTPNRMLLQSIARMFRDDVLANQINFELKGQTQTFLDYQGSIDYQVNSAFVVDVEGDVKVNAPGAGQGQAEVNLAIHEFGIFYQATSGDDTFASEERYQYENETARLYVEDGLVYADLSLGATEIAFFLFPSTNRFFPEKVVTTAPEVLTQGLFPRINEADVNAWIDAMLPMVNGLTLVNTVVTGSNLTISYEIDQSDLPAIYERIYLGSYERSDLTEADLVYLDDLVNNVVSGITLDAFTVQFTLNLLSNELVGVDADIDVGYAYEFNAQFPLYEPENPDADDNGYVYLNNPIVYRYDFAFEFSAALLMFNDPFTLIGPVNKEEYEWIDLDAEDPNLF
jgi:hypothetical protein